MDKRRQQTEERKTRLWYNRKAYRGKRLLSSKFGISSPLFQIALIMDKPISYFETKTYG